MTRLSKFLLGWLGLLLILAACNSAEPELTAEDAKEKAEVVGETAVPPTTQPTNSPTAQPPTPQPVKADFPNLGIAPEIENEVWLNTDEPVTLASQRGKVVLLEFWTFG